MHIFANILGNFDLVSFKVIALVVKFLVVLSPVTPNLFNSLSPRSLLSFSFLLFFFILREDSPYALYVSPLCIHLL